MRGLESRRVFLAAAAAALIACGGGGGDGPEPTRIRWTFQTSPIHYASPALSLDGKTVYFGTSPGAGQTAPGQALHALSTSDGAVRWSYPLGNGQVRSAPAVAPDGSISFVVESLSTIAPGAVTDVVHRLSSSGALLWTFDVNPTGATAGVGLAAPAVAADGAVFVAGDRLYAISPDGQLRWSAVEPRGEALAASPVVGADGTVYFVAHNVALSAYDPADGHVRWTWEIPWPDFVYASPAIGADGTLYVASNDGIVRAVTPAGAVAWQFDVRSAGLSAALRSSPAVGADGSIYFGSSQASAIPAFFSLSAGGQLRWMFVPADVPADVPFSHLDIYSSPALGADGTVYFGQEFGRVYALGAADGKMRWVQPTAQGITWSSPALASDGTLFISDISGRCYAVATGGAGLDAAAPWPRYRGDAQSSGRKR